MKPLVCGTGMIGSNVVRILTEQGHRVKCADLVMGHDLRQHDHCCDAVYGVDTVFHLADRTEGISYSQSHHGRMLTDSLLISLNLLEAARRAKISTYVYVSSSCVYPDSAIHAVSESDSYGPPEKSNEGYGWAKKIAELQCQYYCREYGMRIVIARPANVFGPSYKWSRQLDDMHVIPSLITKMLRGDDEIVVWGSGNQIRTFQYEYDAANLIVGLADKGLSGQAYNLGGEEWDIRHLALLIKDLTGYRGNLTFDGSKPEGAPAKLHDTRKIESILGGTAMPFAQAMELTIEGAKKHDLHHDAIPR